MINAQVKTNFTIPKFDFTRELEYVANKIFIPALKYNMDIEQDIQERAYNALSPKTIKAKTRQGLSLKILQATGALRNSFFSFQRGKNKVVITLKNDRKEIGDILQNQGVVSKQYGLRFFNFFGVSSRMESEALRYMKKRIGELING